MALAVALCLTTLVLGGSAVNPSKRRFHDQYYGANKAAYNNFDARDAYRYYDQYTRQRVYNQMLRNLNDVRSYRADAVYNIDDMMHNEWDYDGDDYTDIVRDNGDEGEGESSRERFDNMRYHEYEDGDAEDEMLDGERESAFGISEESLMKKAEEIARTNVQRELEKHLVQRLEHQMMDRLDRGMEASLRDRRPLMRYGEDLDEDHRGRPMEERFAEQYDNDDDVEPHDSLSRDE